MIWYLAPYVTKTDVGAFVDGEESDPGTEVSGPADDSSELWNGNGKKYVVHAYDNPSAKCLVGFYEAPDAVPSSWVLKTVAEAQTQFQTVKGRSATAKEIN